jgi:hypothetical protein
VIKDVTVISAKCNTQGEGCAPSWGLFGISQPTIPPPFTAHFSAMTYERTCDIISSKCLLAKRRDFFVLIVAEGTVMYAQTYMRGRIERWKYLGVISSQMQDTAQHCDQFGAFREIVGHQELPQYVHQVLHIDFGGARIELSLPHQRHL